MAVVTPPPLSATAVEATQRRVLNLLLSTQIVGGVGVAIGISVGALLAAEMAGTSFSGLAGSASVIGAALVAIPATRLMRTGGRRPGLVFAYLTGATGALVVTVSALTDWVALMFVGMLLFGGGTAAGLQARYTGVDLARPDRRARHLSIVVWATTIGAVAGPNLAPYADTLASGWGVPEYSGPFLFSAVAFGGAALAILVLLRPDPLLTARALAEVPDPAVPAPVPATPAATPAARGIWREAMAVVRVTPGARLGIAAVAVGHAVMVGVMSMTPVYIGGYVHEHDVVLRVVGLVLSLHIAGMFAFSPVVGWLTDRFGRVPVILGGVGVLLLACAVAGTAGSSTPQLAVGLTLLGLGWSGTMVAGSTLLSESVTVEQRPGVQGLADVVMGIAGASAGALSGLVVDLSGYPTLTLLAAVCALPLIGLALRPIAVRAA